MSDEWERYVCPGSGSDTTRNRDPNLCPYCGTWKGFAAEGVRTHLHYRTVVIHDGTRPPYRRQEMVDIDGNASPMHFLGGSPMEWEL